MRAPARLSANLLMWGMLVLSCHTYVENWAYANLRSHKKNRTGSSSASAYRAKRSGTTHLADTTYPSQFCFAAASYVPDIVSARPDPTIIPTMLCGVLITPLTSNHFQQLGAARHRLLHLTVGWASLVGSGWHEWMHNNMRKNFENGP